MKVSSIEFVSLVVGNRQSVVLVQLSVISDRWSVIGGRWSSVGGRWWVVGGRWLVVPQSGGRCSNDKLTYSRLRSPEGRRSNEKGRDRSDHGQSTTSHTVDISVGAYVALSGRMLICRSYR